MTTGVETGKDWGMCPPLVYSVGHRGAPIMSTELSQLYHYTVATMKLSLILFNLHVIIKFMTDLHSSMHTGFQFRNVQVGNYMQLHTKTER